MPEDYEDVSIYTLSDEREARLLEAQTECTFMWTNQAGEPVGVIMNYVFHYRRFWLTATRRRARIPAIERDPHVAVALSSRGTDIEMPQSLTYKGIATVHDDEETKAWFYRALAAAVRPHSERGQAAFVQRLDSPGRVVIAVNPTLRIGFDSENMFADEAAPNSKR